MGVKSSKKRERDIKKVCDALLKCHEPDGRYDRFACSCRFCKSARRILKGDYT